MHRKKQHLIDYISMFIGDLIAIAANALAFKNVENGGALFGLRSNGGRPVVYLVTPAGPGATREYAHFAQDPDYLYGLAKWLQEEFGLQYLGNDHSHRKVAPSHPSGGDEGQAIRMMDKFSLQNMIQIIVTFVGPEKDPKARIDAYLYSNEHEGYRPVKIKLLQGQNPFSHMLAYAECLKENMDIPLIGLSDISFDEYHDDEDLSEGKAVLAEHISRELNEIPLPIAQTAEVDVNNNEASLTLRKSDDASIEILYRLLPDNHCRISEYTQIISGGQRFHNTVPGEVPAPCLVDLLCLATTEKSNRRSMLSNIVIR